MVWDLGEHNAIVIHLTLVPYLAAAGELKQTYTAFRKNINGKLKADILVCRTEHEISDEIRNKLALFCNVKEKQFSLSMQQLFMKCLI
jgi:CTP synthase